MMTIISVLAMMILQVACDVPPQDEEMKMTDKIHDDMDWYRRHFVNDHIRWKVDKYLKKMKLREEKDKKALNGEYHDVMDDVSEREFFFDPEPLTIHVVPHTHDDVGWAKTYEEYFTGANGGVHVDGTGHASVDLIITGVIESLEKDERRKFTYVEMKFFHMWYKK
jgi:hypothetical protein